MQDHIVVGIQDRKLLEKLQLEQELTLEDAVTKVCQIEAVRKQQSTVRADGKDESTVEAIKVNHKHPQQRGTSRQFKHTKSGVCTRCGRSPQHGRQQCPAKDAECHKCHKKGHFKSMYRSGGSVRQVTVDSDEEFLGAITHTAATVKCGWTAKITLNKQEIEFKIGTGADITVIPQSSYQQERYGPLTQVNEPLNGPSQQCLDVSGRFWETRKMSKRSKTSM